MARMKEPVTTKADEKTMEYLMGMMNSLPMKLFLLVKELKEDSTIINQRARQLLKDQEGINARIALMMKIVEELCDVASTAQAIGPMMRVMREKQAGPEDERKGA